jgi:hypothetical protein
MVNPTRGGMSYQVVPSQKNKNNIDDDTTWWLIIQVVMLVKTTKNQVGSAR